MLETLNLTKKLEKETYRKVFGSLQERLRQLQYDLQKAEIATVVIFEGVDGAGKGTTITRLVARLDPRLYRVVPSTAPTDEERGRHFLWVRPGKRTPAGGGPPPVWSGPHRTPDRERGPGATLDGHRPGPAFDAGPGHTSTTEGIVR